MTRWLDYFAIFGDLYQWRTTFVEIGLKVCQIQNKLSKNCQKLLRFCQNSEISPNLVTLVPYNPKHDFTWIFCIFIQVSFLAEWVDAAAARELKFGPKLFRVASTPSSPSASRRGPWTGWYQCPCPWWWSSGRHRFKIRLDVIVMVNNDNKNRMTIERIVDIEVEERLNS